MNGNTYFNLRFYNPLPVQFAAADSEAHVTSGVTRASEPHIFRGLLGDVHSPYFVPGYKKYPFYIKSRTFRGLKKDPFFREIRKESPTIPPPPPPAHHVLRTM